VSPFIRDGVEAGEAVLVVVPRNRMLALQDDLGDVAAAVEWADMLAVGRNPARIIPAWSAFVARQQLAGRPFRGVGEPAYLGRREPEMLECDRHEALLNLAFSTGPAWKLLCPYDTSALPAAVVEAAFHTHPTMVHGVERSPSDRFPLPGPLHHLAPPPPEGVPVFAFEAGDLRAVRRFIATQAAGSGLRQHGVDDLVLAANEIVTNSIRHGGGGGVVRLWGEPDVIVCEVRDPGRVDDPLAGRVVPKAPAESGRGLWMANHLCDLVQLWSGPSGTIVRLHQLR
jgi:anti-sigma regulatory factor (Ser/Thr protein kinase)